MQLFELKPNTLKHRSYSFGSFVMYVLPHKLLVPNHTYRLYLSMIGSSPNSLSTINGLDPNKE
jgi:hypothetical protein